MTKLATVVAALLASSVLAAPDSIELQIPSNKLLPLIADRARTSIGCFDSFTVGGTPLIIDHVEFPSGPTIRRSPDLKWVQVNPQSGFNAHALQLVMPVTAFIKTVTNLNDAATPQESYLLTPSASLIFDLTMTGSGVDRKLCATPAALEPAVMGGDVLLAQLQTQITDQCFPLDLGGVKDLLDGQATVTGVGVSANSTFDTLAVRLELDHPNWDTATWSGFIDQGALTPMTTSSGGFGISFDTELLARVMKKRFKDHLTDPQLTVEHGGALFSQWFPAAPMLNVWFDAQLDVVGCANSIGAHPVNIGMTFGLSSSGDVTVNGQMSWDLVDSDVLLCGLSWAALVGHYGFMMDPVALGVLGGVASSFSAPGNALPPECTMGSNNDFTCKLPLSLPTLKAGGSSAMKVPLVAQSLSRQGSELVISGTASPIGYTTPAPRVKIADVDLAYGLHGTCKNLHAGIEADFIATGSGKLCVQPMKIAADPLAMFYASLMHEIYTSPWKQTVSFGGSNAAQYALHPYQATILARTSGGARTVGLGPVAPVSDAEQLAASFELVHARVSCMKLETGLFGIPGLFDPRWNVDPPINLAAHIRSADPVMTRQPVSVTLTDVSFQLLSQTTRPKGRTYSLGVQDVRMQATATFNFGRLGTFTVPVSTIVRDTFSGSELAETGLVTGGFPARTMAAFSVSSSAFPRAVAGVDFSVDVSPTKLSLHGVLTPQ